MITADTRAVFDDARAGYLADPYIGAPVTPLFRSGLFHLEIIFTCRRGIYDDDTLAFYDPILSMDFWLS